MTDKLDLDKIAKEEYEIQLYGFSIKQFRSENVTFVEQNIEKSVNDLFKCFDVFLKDTKPEFKNKLDAVTNEIVGEIKKSCREDIASVNKIIKDSLSIPENVLLVYDSLLATESSQADVDVQSEECQQLEKNVLENAFFIHALYAEIETYEKLHEIFENEVFVVSKAEEQLNNNLDASLLLNTAKKIHTLMS